MRNNFSNLQQIIGQMDLTKGPRLIGVYTRAISLYISPTEKKNSHLAQTYIKLISVMFKGYCTSSRINCGMAKSLAQA